MTGGHARGGQVEAGAEPVIVKLSPVLCDLFPGSRRRVEVRAATIAETIDELDRLWPGMADRIRDSRPAIRRHMNVFLDGERVGLDQTVKPGDEVFILTAISGG